MGSTERRVSMAGGDDPEVYVKERENSVRKLLNSIPTGRRKSGRPWKTLQTRRYSAIKKDKNLRSSWQEKMQKRREKKSTKDYEKRLKEERASDLKAKRMETLAKQKRKLENEKKCEIVQPIINLRKLKRMKKKDLRMVVKR